MNKGALQDIRVVELAKGWPGRFAASCWATWGPTSSRWNRR
jgi:crotonobetainyl-CoA:carnitine CoA-transferase CaiB-like acyl-CoA transferase